MLGDVRLGTQSQRNGNNSLAVGRANHFRTDPYMYGSVRPYTGSRGRGNMERALLDDLERIKSSSSNNTTNAVVDDTTVGTQCKHAIPAAIYMSVGPSGAGKDTLLLGSRKLLRGNPDVVFVKRHITRDESKVTDLEMPMSVEEFELREANGEHLISWYRHGTHYAIPKCAIEENSGKRLVMNVSRSVIQCMREQFGALGTEAIAVMTIKNP